MPNVQLKNGVTINYSYKKNYENADNVVLFNGAFNTIQDWESMADSIAAELKCNVVTFEMRNQGESTKYTSDFEYSGFIEDAYLLLKHLEIDSVSIITYSSGSAIAVDFIHAYPYLVNTVIFAGPMINPEGMFKTRLVCRSSLAALEQGGMKAATVCLFPMIFSNSFLEVIKDNFDNLLDMFEKSYNPATLSVYMKSWMQNSMNLEKISFVADNTKTHFLYGEEDVYNAPEYVKQLEKKLGINRILFHELKKKGHALHIEDMKGFSDKVVEILKNKPAGAAL